MKLYFFIQDFMTTPASVKVLKRHRSFSNTRDKDSNKVCSKLMCFNSHQMGLAYSKLRRIIDDFFSISQEEVAKSSEEEEKGMGDSTESEKDVRQDQVSIFLS